jgi:hypothetical protein
LDIYDYIAQVRPNEAEAICNKYGWSLQGMESADDLANCLQNLIAEEGQPALADLAGIHPDRDLIIEVYNGQTAQVPLASAPASSGCGCAKCKGNGGGSSVTDKIMSAAGAAQSAASSFFHQSNLMIIGGVVLIGLALVLKSKD